jgi:hypothetical protein
MKLYKRVFCSISVDERYIKVNQFVQNQKIPVYSIKNILIYFKYTQRAVAVKNLP